MKQNLAVLKVKSGPQQPSPVPNPTTAHNSRAIARPQAGFADYRLIPTALRRVPHEELQSAVGAQQRQTREPSDFDICDTQKAAALPR
jgi:hypothetical protein